VVIVTYGLVSFLYESTRERLEQRNRELQRTVEQGTEELAIQKQELARAREIQQSLLPKTIPQIPGFEVATAWQPARTVSGDYFDVFRLGGEHQIGVCIADVVGKGVSAALLMANVQAAVHAFAHEAVSPAEL
jgi:phosphoserine phosphatase RsbU/P